MFCSHCGKQIPDGSSFCQFCGYKVQGISRDPNTMNAPERPDGMASMADVSTDRQRNTKASSKKNTGSPKWLPIVLLIILTLMIAVSVFIFIKRDGQDAHGSAGEPENEDVTKSPIVVLTYPDSQLLYFSDLHKPTHPVVITTYDDSLILEDGVFFSNDGKYLYYLVPNPDMAYYGVCSLYRVLTEELDNDIVSPELIDDYVIMNPVESSYVMETLDNDRILYTGLEFTDEGYCYRLSMYKDGSSSTLLTGREIFVSINRDRTFANIAVMKDNHEYTINDWTWYRMDLGENSAPQFVCEGTLYPFNEVTRDYDYQALTDNDLIINVKDRGEGNGYYTIDLYEHGGFSKKILEYFPWYSVGPFGITVKDNQDVSFFTISTADGNSPTGESFQGESQSWAFFRYKDGVYQEVSDISRFQKNLPDNEIEFSSLRSVGDSVMYAKKNIPGSYSHYKVFDENSNEILFELLWSGSEDYSLYAETSSKKKQFMEGIDLCEELYYLDGKKYLVAYDNYKFLSMCLDGLTADSIDNSETVVETDGYIEQILPCDAKTVLVLTQNGMYEWDGQELKDSKIGSILETEHIDYVWSRGRRIVYNTPRIY